MAQSNAMKGLVAAEGTSQKSQSTAMKDGSRGIATAFATGTKNGELFTVTKNLASTAKVQEGLPQTLASGGSLNKNSLTTFNSNDPANQNTEGDDEDDDTTPPSTNPVGDLTTATNTADDTFDQSNADAGTARVAVRPGCGMVSTAIWLLRNRPSGRAFGFDRTTQIRFRSKFCAG